MNSVSTKPLENATIGVDGIFPEIRDTVIGHTDRGVPVYDNAKSVSCLVIPTLKGVVAVRRNNEPGRGLLGLPGGYQMNGETWQEAGCREAFEETGYIVDPKTISLQSVFTDEYLNNVFISIATDIIREPIDFVPPVEVAAVEYVDKSSFDTSVWAFPVHRKACLNYLEGRKA